MKLFKTAPDGGKDSGVTGFFLVEIKPLFSIVLLHFTPGTREAFHSHAFNAITWWLKGEVEERRIPDPSRPDQVETKKFFPSWRPKFTTRENTHKVFAVKETWALSFRGPWVDTWKEYLPSLGKFVTLTHGRKLVGNDPERDYYANGWCCPLAQDTDGAEHKMGCHTRRRRPTGVYPKRAWW